VGGYIYWTWAGEWMRLETGADAACEDNAFHIFSKLLQILVEYSSIILIFSDFLMPE
jgi:hypothetical protein